MTYVLLGASHSEVPLVKWATEQKIELVTLGLKKSLEVPGAQHFYLDYSNLEAVERIAKRFTAKRIIAGCNDFAAISASFVSDRLKIRSDYRSEQVSLIHDKAAWSAKMAEIGISIPETVEITKDDVSNNRVIKLPSDTGRYLLKPIDLTGGKGVVEVTPETLLEMAKSSLSVSRGDKLLLQRKIEGSLYSVLTLSFNRERRSFFANEEIDSSYRVSYAFMPSSLSRQLQQQVTSAVNKFMDELNIVNGILHVQFMVTNNDFYIIDLCCRPPGDLYFLLLDYCYDIKFAEFIFEPTGFFLCKSEKVEESCVVRYVSKPGESMKWVNQNNVIHVFEIRNSNGSISDVEFSGAIYFLRFPNIDLAKSALSLRGKSK